ncbi:hypothetical protein ACI65C_005454 [Semiaphis heraclei]
MVTANSMQKDESCPIVNVQESGSKDVIYKLHMLLNSMSANLDQLAKNCCAVNDRMNQLEIECIDLSEPLGDVISLERELKRLSEVETIIIRNS